MSSNSIWVAPNSDETLRRFPKVFSAMNFFIVTETVPQLSMDWFYWKGVNWKNLSWDMTCSCINREAREVEIRVDGFWLVIRPFHSCPWIDFIERVSTEKIYHETWPVQVLTGKLGRSKYVSTVFDLCRNQDISHQDNIPGGIPGWHFKTKVESFFRTKVEPFVKISTLEFNWKKGPSWIASMRPMVCTEWSDNPTKIK
jgi:hypothetical protein